MTSQPESQLLKERINRNMLYVGIFSIIMLFAGLTSAVILRQADTGWESPGLPFIFWISTGIILLSSVTANQALSSAKKNKLTATKTALGITLLLGIVFCITQILGWRQMVDANIYFTGPTANVAGSYIYMISGLHLLHILSGLIYLLVVWLNALKNRYNAGNLMGIRHAVIYWHFLDVLWIYLFVFLLLFT